MAIALFRFGHGRLLRICTASVLGFASTAALATDASFESGTYGGSGNNVTIARVPVVNSAGAVTYKNVTIAFTVSSTGVLTAGTPTITTSPVVLTGSFIAGKYRNGTYIFTLSGPGVDSGGRTTWSLLGPSQCPLNVGWTTGAIAGHPQQSRLQTDKITYAGYSYGTAGASGCFSSTWWGPQALAGAAGATNGLTLFSYSSNGTDSSAPTSSLSFSYCQTSAC